MIQELKLRIIVSDSSEFNTKGVNAAICSLNEIQPRDKEDRFTWKRPSNCEKCGSFPSKNKGWNHRLLKFKLYVEQPSIYFRSLEVASPSKHVYIEIWINPKRFRWRVCY